MGLLQVPLLLLLLVAGCALLVKPAQAGYEVPGKGHYDSKKPINPEHSDKPPPYKLTHKPVVYTAPSSPKEVFHKPRFFKPSRSYFEPLPPVYSSPPPPQAAYKAPARPPPTTASHPHPVFTAPPAY